jgi:Transcriptional activator of glycolytic enzymes
MANNNGEDDGWTYPIGHTYQPVMVEFMSFLHGAEEYPDDAVFTRDQLLEIKPVDVKRYLCMKAYNDPDPDINNGARPTNGRSDSLYYAKKALSKYMPYRTANWVNGQGNPTKSDLVNDMIKQVKKFEVRGEGAASNAKRPLKQSEFRKTLQLFRGGELDWNHKFRYPMMALWQYHLIGRVDDVVNFKLTDPKGHGEYDFALKTKVRWSKNVMEERQCPPQLLLGAMDPMFCLLLNFAIYLEEMLFRNPDQVYLFTDATSDNAPKNLIQTYRKRLEKVVWNHEEFKALATEDDTEGVGTHSYRKFPSNYARGCGCTPDEIEIRGRWKSQGQRTVFRYIDVKQLTIDAKVCGVLCVGGPIKYKLKPDVTLTDDWLFEHVVPNIRKRFPEDSRLCRVLGTALLFGAMDPEVGEKYVPQGIRQRISSAYLPTHPAIQQPVARVPLTIYRVQDTLMIDEMIVQGDNGGGNGPTAGTAAGTAPVVNQQQHAQVLINLQALQQNVAQNHQQQQESMASLRTWCGNQFRTINNNIRAHGGTIQGAFARQDPQQQARRRQATDPEQQVEQEGTLPATLAKQPRTLAELWEEYQHGIGGRKPAKDWSGVERGNRMHGIKQKYYRRKMVWLTIEKLMQRGDSRNAAINRIRQAYGWRCSVTQIINFIIASHQNGGHGHPNLVDLTPYLRRGGRRTANV